LYIAFLSVQRLDTAPVKAADPGDSAWIGKNRVRAKDKSVEARSPSGADVRCGRQRIEKADTKVVRARRILKAA
jgi:hypothetical protein